MSHTSSRVVALALGEEEAATKHRKQRQPFKRLLALAFSLLGVGVLCPFNAFINARPYFESRLCHDGKTSFGNNIEVWFSVLYNFASVLSLVVLLLVQYYCGRHRHNRAHRSNNMGGDSQQFSVFHSTTLHHPFSSSLRSLNRVSSIRQGEENDSSSSSLMVLIPLWLYFAVFLLTTMLVYVPQASAVVVFYITLVGLFLCGVCTSVASAGIIGTAGLFDADVGVGPYFQGQALGGLIVAVMNAITAFYDNPTLYRQAVCQNIEDSQSLQSLESTNVCVPYDTINYSTGAYFCLNCLILLGCVLGYMFVDKAKHRLNTIRYSPISEIKANTINRMDSTASTFSTETESAGEEVEASYQGMAHNRWTTDTQSTTPMNQHQVIAHVAKIVKLPAIALFLTYLVTLAIFPVITSDLTSVQECTSPNRVRNDMFVPFTFLVFNFGDLLGRFVVADDGIEKHCRELPNKLMNASIARFMFVPLFFVCYSRKSVYLEMAVHSDVFSWVIQLAMAVTNGILTTVSFSVVAVLLPSDENMQQIGSSIMNLSLCLGLMTGGLAAYPMMWLYTGSW